MAKAIMSFEPDSYKTMYKMKSIYPLQNVQIYLLDAILENILDMKYLT